MRLRKPSLSRDFILLVALIAIVTMLLSAWFSWQTYSSEENRVTQILAAQAGRVERTLTSHFDYTEHMMTYMARQVSQNGAGTDIDYLYELLRSFRTDPKVDNLLSWSTFMWHNKQHQIIVEGVKGVLDTPRDLSKRDYIAETVAAPQSLKLGQPVYGAVSGQWIIPGGVGAVDVNGHYIGGISMGFNIAKLISKLDQAVNAPGITLGLFDKDLVLIGQTPTSDFSNLNKTFTAKLKKNIPLELSALISATSLLGDDKGFIYYQALTKYPYVLVLKYDKNLSDHEIWNAMFLRIAELFVIAALIIVILFFLHRRIIIPVVHLADTAEKIARGNYALRAAYAGNGEVGKLTHAFNAMLEQVETAKNGLEQKVTERTASLQQALNAKDEFLNNMSHEIRLPTGVVMGRASMLLEDWDELDEPTKKDHANAIYESCKRLFGLLSNLLDLSKFNAGKMTYSMVASDLAAIAERAIAEFSAVIAAKKLTVEFIKEESAPLIMLDPIRIVQVIRNLLSNAIKFTAAGKLTITLTSMQIAVIDGRKVDGLAFSIKDQGVGIPPEELSSIFDVFIQSSKTRTGAGGTGLGLSISKEIITAHHGILWAENNADGKGSIFTFVIPVTNAPRA